MLKILFSIMDLFIFYFSNLLLGYWDIFLITVFLKLYSSKWIVNSLLTLQRTASVFIPMGLNLQGISRMIRKLQLMSCDFFMVLHSCHISRIYYVCCTPFKEKFEDTFNFHLLPKDKNVSGSSEGLKGNLRTWKLSVNK